jgi:hypothetical protein
MPVRRTNRYTSRNTKWNRKPVRKTSFKPWTPTEVKTLRKIYKDTPTKDIARKFSRSVSSVQAKASSFGLKKTKMYMKQMYQGMWK